MSAKRVEYRVVLLALCLACLGAAPGCGGGGGGAAIQAPAAVLAILKAELRGSNETSVIDADARATVVVQVLDNGEFRWAATAESGWVGDIIGAHIHRGAAGVDGPIEVDLLAGGATFDAQDRTAAATSTGPEALAIEVAGAPGNFYVNIHTNAAPAGLVRSQLEPFGGALEWHATLLGSNESNVVDANARGAATFAVAADGTVSYVLAMSRPQITDVTSAHIHVGSAGVDGGILVDLDLPAGALDASSGTVTGTVSVDRRVLSRICQDIAGFYCNAHSAGAPAGIARGQMATGTVEMWAQLTGDQETVVVDADARGGASFEFFTFDSGLATLAVPQAQGIGAVNAAHIHIGGPGVDGTVMVDLQAGADYNISPPTGSADGTVTYDQALLTRMMADPGGFYCNFHSAAAPSGLVRGQLTRDPQTFFAALSGAEETTVVDPGAAGGMTCVFQQVHECSFTLTMGNPPASAVTAAHIHDGFAGTDGPILVDFLNGFDIQVSSAITGRATVGGRTFTRLLAQPEQMYVNAHTAAAPAGIARGQCVHVSGDIPPAGLSYTTPVVYMTEVAISANVPTSVGGAITSYSVSPALPPGLQLDPATGILSGTPTGAAVPATDYTVTASNDAGSTTAIVNITVDLSPPASLGYTTPVTYTVNTPATPNVPTSTGGQITGFSVSPALPAGLGINTVNGTIGGTPTAVAAAADYTVTGSNAAGSVQAVVNITVASTLQPPSGLSYTSPVVYTTGTAITPNTPTVGGGAVSGWSITPALPAGLSFSTATGVISGTPTAISSAANYTVTASNAAGSTTATVNITVNLGAPTNLSYNPNSALGYVTGGTFPTMTPSSGGGAVSSYSISPALPAGISINTTTGTISGTPTTTSSQTTYTVTATNAAGSTTATVTVTILP